MKNSQTETLVKQPYKAVISVPSLDCDKTLKGKLAASFDTGYGIPQVVQIPTEYPLILDISKDTQHINVTFLHSEDERDIADGKILVAPDIAYNVEVDTNSIIETRIHGCYCLNDMIRVNFKLTYVNTILFQAQGEPLIETIGPKTRGDTSPLHQRISPTHPTKNKEYKYDEAMLHDYTHRVITQKLG